MLVQDDFIWVEKYRPRKVEDVILPSLIKKQCKAFVESGNIPNLILHGKSGTGKTTMARAMLEELGCNYIVINGSLEGRHIDTLRNEIMSFASSVSLTGGRKYVIIDEADFLNALSVQPALRNFMEEFSKNCGFILTCNFVNKIIDALHSRCSVIEFKIPNEEKLDLVKQFIKRLTLILKEENVEYDVKVLGEFTLKYFPDWRRTINEIQRYASVGKIDSGILSNTISTNLKELINSMKEKNYTNVRKWVGQNSDIDSERFFREFYDQASVFFKKESIPQLILILADYQFKAAFVADLEINMSACLAEIMVQCQFTS